MKIGITGKRTTIVREFISICKDSNFVYGTTLDLPLNLDRYLLCAGVMYGKNILEMNDDEVAETIRINFTEVVRFCERVFAVNSLARICIIGSESGFNGSYDIVYATSKSGIHLYVETKKLAYSSQHLVAVAPHIIEDSGMTRHRKDLTETLERGRQQHLGRWLNPAEVARSAVFALEESALCNRVIRMTGGNQPS